MDSRTTTSPPAAADVVAAMHDPEPSPDANKISAYYSLVFPNFTYYLQTLNVSIGRRSVPSSSASSSDTPQVDVDLGPLKSVSRLHAKIEYEEEQERFVLLVIGRNGAWVDGVWSGSGSRVPLGQRSQIQITSRTFHFVLPPPPPPEDSPSPSSHASTTRLRSPSVDILDITSNPPTSPRPLSPPAPVKPPPDVKPNAKSKSNPRKRKKPDLDGARPKPEIMPPKPQFTYAQLCYRAIKSLGGKGTLQEICTWIMENFEWYKYNQGSGWESSVRHNLSQNRAFQKSDRNVGERGKGYVWRIDKECEATFEEQEAKMDTASGAQVSGAKEGKQGKKKERGGASPSDPPLKRSVKGELKGGPLPPPLTSTPLAFKTVNPPPPPLAPIPSPLTRTPMSIPVAPLVKPEVSSRISLPTTSSNGAQVSPPSITTSTGQSAPSFPSLPPSMLIPIVIGPVPPSHPSASSSDQQYSSTSAHLPTPPIVLHENTLILNPSVFSHLTPAQLKELESLGAQKALEILQSYIVRFIKERIKTEGARGRGRGRAKRGRGGGRVGKDGLSTTRPDSTTPSASGTADTSSTHPAGPSANVAPPQQTTAVNMETNTNTQAVDGPVPMIVSEQPPAPIPLYHPPARSPSPFLVVDDLPDAVEPALKRRRLEVGEVSG